VVRERLAQRMESVSRMVVLVVTTHQKNVRTSILLEGNVGDNKSKNPDIGPKGESYFLSSVEEGKTNPTFTGGTLVVDKSGPTTSQNFSVKEVEGNTIDSNGNYVLFKGSFEGNGGLTFIGSDDDYEIQLEGNVGYEGETIVKTSGGVALAIQNKDAAPKGDITIKDGAILRLRGDDIELDGDVVLEGGTIGVFGEAIRIRGDVELKSGQSKVLCR
jgi:hypothetical protein